MHLIVCVDERAGMSFGGRRQSRDRILCEDVLADVRQSGARLYLSPYSAPLFEGAEQDILCVSETYLTDAGAEDFCFCEREAIAPHAARVDAVTVYRWNRHYPSDRKLDLDLSAYKLYTNTEFAGSSHEKITKEVYVK
jgi:hypothetical protein